MTLFGEHTHRDVSQKFSLLFHSLAMDVVYVRREAMGITEMGGAGLSTDESLARPPSEGPGCQPSLFIEFKSITILA